MPSWQTADALAAAPEPRWRPHRVRWPRAPAACVCTRATRTGSPTGRAHSRRRDDAGDVEDGGGGDGRNKVFLPSSDNCIYGERMVVGYVGTLRALSLCGMPSLTLNTC